MAALSNRFFFVIGRIANFLIGRVEPAILLCMILGKPFGAKAASASDNSYLSICSPFCNTQIPVVAESGGAQGEGGLSLLPSSLVDFVALIFFNLFLPMSDEPLLAGAALVAAANGTLRAEAVAFVDVAQQRNT